jgi:CRP/FNR family transcriptional regulator, cyclic AMP receptor protein
MAEAILKAIPVLHDLEEEELKKFFAVTHRLQVPTGTAVIREGEAGDAMYILVEGAVEISKSLVMKMGREDFQGRDKILTKLSSTDHAVFGEVALFEQGKRTATVTALNDCALLEINRDDFLRLAEENPRIGYKITRNITQILCSRLRKADEDTIKLTTALSLALGR